jgi:integrase
MAGQLIKRGDNIWLVRVFLGRHSNGKRRHLNKTVHGTKKDAGKFLTAKLREKDLGINIEPASESLDKYLDTWLDAVLKSRVRTRTFDDYSALIDRYIRKPLGALKLSDLRPLHIQKLYRSMVWFLPQSLVVH